MPDFGMPVAILLAGTAERHAMQHGNVVLHHRRFADDDVMGVIDHDALADPRARMDIDREDHRHAALQIEGEIPASQACSRCAMR